MKKALVTGAGGFIGSHMAKYLVEKGYHVRVVDIKFDDYIDGIFYHEKLTLDLRNLKSCVEACEGMDEVYNLAANMGGIGYITSVHAEVASDNILINVNMLEAIRLLKIKRVFYSSSACVYPNFKQTTAQVVPLKEEDAIPADPNEIYGWEKLFSEQLYEAYKNDCGVEVRVARFHNVFGEEGTYKDGREKAPAAMCRKIAIAKLTNCGNFEMWGDGEQTRSFMHIKDCVEGIFTLMQSNYSKPLNIGSDRLISINALAKLVMNIAGVELDAVHDLSKPQGVRGRNSDNSFCKETIKWEPKYTLEEGLKTTYAWIEDRVKEDLGLAIKYDKSNLAIIMKEYLADSIADAHVAQDHLGLTKGEDK